MSNKIATIAMYWKKNTKNYALYTEGEGGINKLYIPLLPNYEMPKTINVEIVLP